MRLLRAIPVMLMFVVVALPALGQVPRVRREPPPRPHHAPPPPARPGDLPLVFPGSRVERQIDLFGENLQKLLAQDPSLKGVTRLRIVDFVVPKDPLDGPLPPQVVDHYDRMLSDRGWKPLWRNSGMGRPRMVYSGPEGHGFFSLVAQPRGFVVTHIEGLADIRKMPDVERLIRMALKGPMEPLPGLREADILRRQGKTDEAVQAYKAVIAKDPGAPGPYLGLGSIQMEQGKLTEAEESFRRAIELDPLNAAARGNYARLLSSKKNWRDAEYEARQAAALAPELPVAHLVLAEVLESRGKLKESAEEYTRFLRTPNSRPDLYVKLGRLLERLGQREEALQRYRDALKLDPAQQEALQGVERLSK